MVKKTFTGRLASAQERLRRMEKTIGPYVDKRAGDLQRTRDSRWVPSDTIHVTDHKDQKSREKPEMEMASIYG